MDVGPDATAKVIPGQRHVSVLLDEVLAVLAPRAGATIVDGTFGAGGYSAAMLRTDLARVVAFDRDPTAIAAGADLAMRHPDRLTLLQRPFSQLQQGLNAIGIEHVDGIVLDIGVSSMQLDEAERGFSFRQDGPLDMRMAQAGSSAADLVNTLDEAALAEIIFTFGEERFSRPIAKAIVAARTDAPIITTQRLVSIIGTVLKQRYGEIHPATRTFQALRIAVNDELGELSAALDAAERVLRPGGTLAVVTFHSLEDRIVKRFFAARSSKGGGSRHLPMQADVGTFVVQGKWPIVPGEAEVAANPRARSAKLRAGQRNDRPSTSIPADAHSSSIDRPMSAISPPRRRSRS